MDNILKSTEVNCSLEKFMNSKTAAALDETYERLKWDSEEYNLEALREEAGGLKKGAIYLGFHTLDIEMAIDRLKGNNHELYSLRILYKQFHFFSAPNYDINNSTDSRFNCLLCFRQRIFQCLPSNTGIPINLLFSTL